MPAPSRCAFVLPPIPVDLPAIPLPPGVAALIAATLQALADAKLAIPVIPFCPLD